ncbi:MAG: ATP-grasp domain-containing protein [Patescibacteria group bacterium]
MDLLIFTKAPSAYEPSRIFEEGRKFGLKAGIVAYSDLDFVIKNSKVMVFWQGKALPEAKMVIFRAAGGDDFYIPQRDYLIAWFNERGAKVLNAATYKKWSRLDKITQHFEFFNAGIPFIDSQVYGLNERLLSQTKSFPAIIKKNLSSRGKDVFKIEKKKDFTRLFDQGYWARTMLLQPFLKIGQDIRVIVIGGKVIGAMKRTAQPGKYLTNYSQGGIIAAYDIQKDPQAIEIAAKTAKHFLLDYVGVDLMMSDEGLWQVLEVNRACQFKGFEEATKINVPEKVINFLQSKRR